LNEYFGVSHINLIIETHERSGDASQITYLKK